MGIDPDEDEVEDVISGVNGNHDHDDLDDGDDVAVADDDEPDEVEAAPPRRPPPPPTPPPEPAPEPPKKRRRRVSKADKAKSPPEEVVSKAEVHEETPETEGPQLTMEELEAQMSAPARLPKASENVRTLGSLIAEFQIGQKPDFKLHLYRLWPKLFPGNRKADGFYAEIEQPIDEKMIQEEYGGGTYRVSVIGPHDKSPTGSRQFASVQVNIGGAPREDRLPRNAVAVDPPAANPAAQQQPPPFMMATENPKLAEAALKMFEGVAASEREERRRVEDKTEASLASAKSMLDPIIDAEKRHAENIVRLEQEKSKAALDAAEARRQAEAERWEEKLREAQERVAEERTVAAEAARRMEMEQSRRPTFGEELREIMPLMKSNDDGGGARLAESTGEMARKMLDEASKQHAQQMDAMRSSYETQMASMRVAQESAMQSLREAQQREMAAIKEQQLHREARHEDLLKAEREERRRDSESARKQQEDRDRTWKERMENMEINLKTQWESRLATTDANNSERVQWMQREMDRREAENRELRAANAERGDVVAQLHRAQELQDVAKKTFGLSGDSAPAAPAAAPSIFAGLDVNNIVEDVMKKGPEWIAALRAAPQTQQQSYYPGQRVPTKNGPMIVIQTQRGLEFTPEGPYLAAQAAAEAKRRSPPLLQQGAPQGASHGNGQRRPAARPPQGAPQVGRAVPRPKTSEENFETVPNMAEGLPRMVPPWERKMSVNQAMGNQAVPQAEAAPMPVQSFAMPVPAPQEPVEEIPMGLFEKQIAIKVAELVSESLSSGDEPTEFVARVLGAGYPDAVVQGLAGKTDIEILTGIAQVAPGSAGTTAGGRAFIVEAMAALRAAVAGGPN